MATLRDVFGGTHPEGNVARDRTVVASGRSFVLNARCHFSFETNSRFVSYFVSEPDEWQAQFRVLVNNPRVACDDMDQSVEFSMGNPSLGVPMRNAKALLFTGRMYLYVETALNDADRAELLAAGQERGLSIELRDLNWLAAYNASSRPLAFLSHDSRDKDEVARPLVEQLGTLLCPLWYDEYSLRVGDSLTESIDRGIRESPKCVLILSPHFFENSGWTKAEFKAVMNRHIQEGAIILPVWHDVTRDDVYAYSSFLVDIVASKTSSGLATVARELAAVLKPPA